MIESAFIAMSRTAKSCSIRKVPSEKLTKTAFSPTWFLLGPMTEKSDIPPASSSVAGVWDITLPNQL